MLSIELSINTQKPAPIKARIDTTNSKKAFVSE
jgi:hypothetical protein